MRTFRLTAQQPLTLPPKGAPLRQESFVCILMKQILRWLISCVNLTGPDIWSALILLVSGLGATHCNSLGLWCPVISSRGDQRTMEMKYRFLQGPRSSIILGIFLEGKFWVRLTLERVDQIKQIVLSLVRLVQLVVGWLIQRATFLNDRDQTARGALIHPVALIGSS